MTSEALRKPAPLTPSSAPVPASSLPDQTSQKPVSSLRTLNCLGKIVAWLKKTEESGKVQKVFVRILLILIHLVLCPTGVGIILIVKGAKEWGLQQERANLEQENWKLKEVQARALSKQLAAHQDQMQKSAATHQLQLQRVVNEKAGEVQHARQETQALRSAHATEMARVTTLKDTLEQRAALLEKENAGLTTTINTANADLKVVRNQLDATTTEHRALATRMGGFEKRAEELTTENQRLKQEMAAARAAGEGDSVDAELGIEALLQENANLRAQLQRAEFSAKASLDESTVLEKTLAYQTDLANRYKGDKEMLSSQLDKTENVLRTQQGLLMRRGHLVTRDPVKGKDAELRGLQDDLKALRAENALLRKQLSKKETAKQETHSVHSGNDSHEDRPVETARPPGATSTDSSPIQLSRPLMVETAAAAAAAASANTDVSSSLLTTMAKAHWSAETAHDIFGASPPLEPAARSASPPPLFTSTHSPVLTSSETMEAAPSTGGISPPTSSTPKLEPKPTLTATASATTTTPTPATAAATRAPLVGKPGELIRTKSLAFTASPPQTPPPRAPSEDRPKSGAPGKVSNIAANWEKTASPPMPSRTAGTGALMNPTGLVKERSLFFAVETPPQTSSTTTSALSTSAPPAKRDADSVAPTASPVLAETLPEELNEVRAAEHTPGDNVGLQAGAAPVTVLA